METKRQWMQSFDGRIRVGPEYQAMIPPFCRIPQSQPPPSSVFSGEASPAEGDAPKDAALRQPEEPKVAMGEEYMESYSDLPEENLDDITSHINLSDPNYAAHTGSSCSNSNSDSEDE